MTSTVHRRTSVANGRLLSAAICVLSVLTATVRADLPNPVLNAVFPPGGQAGTTVEVTVSGTALDGFTRIVCSHLDVTFEKGGKNEFRAAIPQNVPPGLYDLRVVGANGLSSARTFFVGNRAETVEAEPNDSRESEQTVPLNATVNARIAKGGDVDRFRFSAKRGQRVVIECWAERIDSRLRAVLELYDTQGRRLAVNRGYFGIDPLIDFRVPADGDYVVKLFDLIYSGSGDHFYRLDIDTGPRVAFAVPSVVERGKKTKVILFGWNLHGNDTKPAADTIGPSAGAGRAAPTQSMFDRVEVEVTPPKDLSSRLLPMRLRPSQVSIDGFAYHHPGSHASEAGRAGKIAARAHRLAVEAAGMGGHLKWRPSVE